MCDDTSTPEMLMKSVYHSADSILRVLKAENVNSLHGVEILINRFNEKFPEGVVHFSNASRKELFVVFEGLDGSGKSTVAKQVSKFYKGVTMATPPKSISDVRKTFDSYDPSVRKAYYSLGNYIAAKEIQDICEERPVFLDRFWHSTAAYALAKECNEKQLGCLPCAGDPVYKWPEDLLKPDLVLFLDVTEQARAIRHARRVKRGETTKEEEQLVKDEAFRNLLSRGLCYWAGFSIPWLAAFCISDPIPIVYGVCWFDNSRKCLRACEANKHQKPVFSSKWTGFLAVASLNTEVIETPRRSRSAEQPKNEFHDRRGLRVRERFAAT